MTAFPTVRVAALQATPVVLDSEATIDKSVALIAQAAEAGAQLAVLPECFVSVYPSGAWAAAGAQFGGVDELWERLWDSSVDVSGPEVQRLVDACRTHRLHLVIGVNEREDVRPGTLYNAMLLLGPDGLLWHHRKTMPTMQERVFYGMGAGKDLHVTDVPGVGRVAGLICWENRMPMARWALYQGGPQIWVAPTADDSDGWQASMRSLAIEAGAFVVSVPQYLPRAAFPDDFPAEIPAGLDCLGRGGAAVIDPMGRVIAGPLYDTEGMVVADCDLRVGLQAKRWFDSVGHYSRPDLFPPSAAGVELVVEGVGDG
ncbi:MAG TPA: carbon-nitrogen hydrolase family protein [Acidimicrobiales bacterium]|nr:carbon-nitrogen hydrolase family protein [Acidimicrobiales bacterium]